MPTITKISKKIKKEGRFNIFLNGKFSFGVSEEVLLNEKLKVGLEIDAAKLEYLKSIIEKDKTMEKVLNFLAYRPRSVFEIKQYLQRKNIEPVYIDEIITKLKRLGYLNDTSFARWYIEQRRSGSKRWGKKKIFMSLKNLGIENEVIEQELKASNFEISEVENARSEARKYVKKIHEKDLYKAKKKLSDALSRRGYSW